MKALYILLALSGLLVTNASGNQPSFNKTSETIGSSSAVEKTVPQSRQPPHIRKEVNSLLREGLKYLVPKAGTEITKSDPGKTLSILENHTFQDLNPNEIAQIHLLKAYAYEALGKYENSISEFLSVVDSSPQISIKAEAQALRSLWQRYAALRKNSESLQAFKKWTKLTNEISYEDCVIISNVFEAERDIPSAIEYLMKAINIAGTGSENLDKDYYHLASLYRLNNQHKEADEILATLVIPTNTVPHTYPTSALTRGIQGHCDVTFDVTPTGATSNIHIKPGACVTSKGETTDVFNRSSINAMKKFKYKPKIENGQAVVRKDVTYRFTYKMAN